MPKVLVVDDAPDTVKLLALVLANQGYELSIARNGREALDVASAERPDVILLDIMMPEMDGIEACRRLKADGDLCRVPVILLTAKGKDEDIVHGLDAGADDYVTKPFDHRVLAARVRAALRVKESHDLLVQANQKLRAEMLARLQAEEDVRKKEDELRHARHLEAVGRLAGGVAHEFNNVLQIIISYASSAMNGLARDMPGHADLKKVLTAASRAAAITRQLLGFSRRQRLERRHVDVNQAIADLAKFVRPVIGGHIEFEVVLGARSAVVHADSGEIQQALLNLCLNARDAMPNGGKLTISTENAPPDQGRPEAGEPWPTADCLVVTVADTGCGMPPEVKEHLFEPFFTTKEVGQGTGLGLATVYGIVRQHGGAVRVSSKPGEGTTFTITLPAVQAQPDAEAAAPAGPTSGGTETILVAEDEPLVRDFVKLTLEKAGYTVLAVEDGAKAVRTYQENPQAVSLALLDVVLPKLTGREAYQRIKADHADAKIILCTGCDPGTASAGLVDREKVRLLEKPFTKAALLRLVRETIDA